MKLERFYIDQPRDDQQYTQDIASIHTLWRSITLGSVDAPISTSQPADPAQLKPFLEGFDYLVARHDQTRAIIGAISLLDCGRGLIKIDALAVATEHRRRGYARTLASTAVEHCIQQHANQCITHALPSSQPLFASLGFEAFERNSKGAMTMFLDLSDSE